ncbi:MAG TPA: hypothetical protein VFV80_06205 [Geminicoccaceae bacterium]|nr:hypothetical protein [Geminicoccaceae bacterium]
MAMQAPISLAQRTGYALAQALRHDCRAEPLHANGRIRRVSDLLIDGIEQDRLPDALDRARLRQPHSATALAINTFLPWQAAPGQMTLDRWTGFDAIQLVVRCPTGLRGTPPHLDVLALRDDAAVAVTVRCTEYLSRRRSPVAPSYDRLLAATPGLDPWLQQLAQLRAAPECRQRIDLGALVKHALALGRTFPDRPTSLLYLYWEPLDAERFPEFGVHRRELGELADEVRAARVAFASRSFLSLWRDWDAQTQPAWLARHVTRLRARYGVTLASGEHAG